MTRCGDDDVCGHLIIVVVGLKIIIIATTKLKSNMDDEKKKWLCDNISIVFSWMKWMARGIIGKDKCKNKHYGMGFIHFSLA